LASGGAQTLPQLPQFCVSLDVFRHEPPHAENPCSQVMPQARAVHVALPLVGTLHAMPQPPQLAGSVSTLTHWSPHCVVPAAQPTTQDPP